MKRRNKQLLAENEYLKELLAVLKENPSPSGRDFAEMVAHVGELENRLAEAVEELRTMRQELLQVQNRSLKAVLQRSCKALEQNISNMSRKLSELKKLIIGGCKEALAACSATRFLRNSDRIIEKKQRHSKKHFRARSNASTAPEKAGSRPCKGAGFFGARRSGFAAPPAPSKPKG